MIKVLLFAQLAEQMNAKEIYVESAVDTNEIIDILNKKFSWFCEAKYVVAVDKTLIQTNTPLDKNATVAFLPPYSGG